MSRLRRRGQRNGTFDGSSPSRLPTEADSSPWQGRPPVLLPSLRTNRRGQRPAQMRGWCVQAQRSLRALQLTSGAEHTQPHDFMRHPTDACARLPVQSKREHLSILAVCIQRGVHWAIGSARHPHRKGNQTLITCPVRVQRSFFLIKLLLSHPRACTSGEIQVTGGTWCSQRWTSPYDGNGTRFRAHSNICPPSPVGTRNRPCSVSPVYLVGLKMGKVSRAGS